MNKRIAISLCAAVAACAMSATSCVSAIPTAEPEEVEDVGVGPPPVTDTGAGMDLAEPEPAPAPDSQGCTDLFYPDADRDGFGDSGGPTVTACAAPAGHTSDNTDCDDADPLVNPSQTEVVGDGADNNCDGLELCLVDGDADGFVPDEADTISTSDTQCAGAGLALSTSPSGDCDDADPLVNPGAQERCDGVDNNCDLALGGCSCPLVAGDFGSAYQMCQGNLNWEQARSACQSDGFHLVKVDSIAENSFILQEAQRANLGESWLGLNDLEEGGRFVWHDGSEPNFTNWNDNQPNNQNDQDCAELHVNENDLGTWNDEECTNSQSYICELSL